MSKLAMGMMMSAVLVFAASTCQAAGKDWGNRGGDHSASIRNDNHDGGFRGGDRDDHRFVGHDRDFRDRGHVAFYGAPAYRSVYVCPAPVVYYTPAPVYVASPCYRPGFSFSFGW